MCDLVCWYLAKLCLETHLSRNYHLDYFLNWNEWPEMKSDGLIFPPKQNHLRLISKKVFYFETLLKWTNIIQSTFLNTDIWIKSYRGLKHPPASAGTCIQALVLEKPTCCKDTTPMCHHWHCSRNPPRRTGEKARV